MPRHVDAPVAQLHLVLGLLVRRRLGNLKRIEKKNKDLPPRYSTKPFPQKAETRWQGGRHLLMLVGQLFLGLLPPLAALPLPVAALTFLVASLGAFLNTTKTTGANRF